MSWVCSTYRDRRVAYKVWVGKPERKRLLGRTRVDGRIILKLMFKKWEGDME